MDEILRSIRTSKEQLDQLRPLSSSVIASLQKYYDVELTYTSNAIEGNTLTLRETAEVIEHGITVGGKQLKEHLEAVDHYDALHWMRQLAAQTVPISESVVPELHAALWRAVSLILRGSTVRTGAASSGPKPFSRTP